MKKRHESAFGLGHVGLGHIGLGNTARVAMRARPLAPASN